MNNSIYLIGEVGYDITLQSVIDLIKDTDPDQPLFVHIHSPGGAVYDGVAIYNHLKSLDREVNTVSSGLVASIASVIYLAGQSRSINSTDSFLIHLPMNFGGGTAEDFEKSAQELRRVEKMISEIYEDETNISAAEALEMMKEDIMLDVNVLKEKGFVTNIVEFKAVATLINKNNNQMAELNKEDKTFFSGLFNEIKNLIKPEKPTNKIVQDATGVDIDFSELEDDATPADGDKAKVDGKDAEGEYVMPSGDTYKFEAGVLTIVAGESDEEEEVEDSEEVTALKQKITELETQLETSNTATTEAVNKSTEVIEKFNTLEASMKSKFNWDGKSEDEDADPNKRPLLV